MDKSTRRLWTKLNADGSFEAGMELGGAGFVPQSGDAAVQVAGCKFL